MKKDVVVPARCFSESLSNLADWIQNSPGEVPGKRETEQECDCQSNRDKECGSISKLLGTASLFLHLLPAVFINLARQERNLISLCLKLSQQFRALGLGGDN